MWGLESAKKNSLEVWESFSIIRLALNTASLLCSHISTFCSCYVYFKMCYFHTYRYRKPMRGGRRRLACSRKMFLKDSIKFMLQKLKYTFNCSKA